MKKKQGGKLDELQLKGGGILGRTNIPSREGWGREIIIVVEETDTSCDILEGQSRPRTCIWIHIMCIMCASVIASVRIKTDYLFKSMLNFFTLLSGTRFHVL